MVLLSFKDVNTWLIGLPVLSELLVHLLPRTGDLDASQRELYICFYGNLGWLCYGLKEDKIISAFMNGALTCLA